MKARTIIFRVLIITVIGIIIGGSVYSWNARRVVGNSLPMPFGIGASVVLTGSMEPTLSVNDLVFIKAQDSYKEGDVIVFQDGRSLVIHRIIYIDEQTVNTQGDANDVDDGPRSVKDIKGRMVFAIPFIGLIVRGLKTPPGTIIMLAAAVFLMNLSWKKEKEAGNKDLDHIKDEIRRLKAEMDNGTGTEAADAAEEGPQNGPAEGSTGDAERTAIRE